MGTEKTVWGWELDLHRQGGDWDKVCEDGVGMETLLYVVVMG